MPTSLLNPEDSIERQHEKLLKIVESLMRRVEEKTRETGLAYTQFERAAMLQAQVRRRTEDLERALELLHDSNMQLAEAKQQAEAARSDLADAIETIDGGFALFGPDDRLLLSNTRFCRELTDVKDHIAEGATFADYIEAVSTSGHLALPDGETPGDWVTRRLERHDDDLAVFNVHLSDDRWIQVNEHRTATGGTVILQTDVTELMRTEREERARLRDSQARMLRATLDHLDQGICIFDSRGQLAGWNSRMASIFELAGYGREEVLALPFTALVRRLGRDILYGGAFGEPDVLGWAAQRGGRRPLTFEVSLNGDQTISVFAQEMPDRGFVISFTDVTAERKAARDLARLNEELEQRVEARTLELGDALAAAERANASKSRFVAAASHDLLQPLSAAKLFIQSLADDTGGDPGTAKMVAEKAARALSGAEHIIEALLDMSRLDIGEASFTIKPVALDGMLASVCDELRPLAEEKGVSLRVVPSSLNVESDPRYLRRIVQNLTGNAVRYTDSGKVLIGVRRAGGMARIEVHDTGPGIAPDDQELIFQEFKRLGAGARHNGLGLGLAIVERACKALGHGLGLRSEPGRGSSFSVTIPTSAERSPAGSQARPVARRETDLTGTIVLLVENDALLARALTMMIESWGGEVIGAATGEEALALLDEIDLRPDAALLDHQLGYGMTGTQLIARLREVYGDLPARIVSADRTQSLKQECAALGVGLLNKPVDRAILSEFLSHPTGALR